MKSVNEQISNAIQSSNLSQYKIAKDLKISQGYLSEVLKGKKNPNINYLEKLCNYLGYKIKISKK